MKPITMTQLLEKKYFNKKKKLQKKLFRFLLNRNASSEHTLIK